MELEILLDRRRRTEGIRSFTAQAFCRQDSMNLGQIRPNLKG